MKNTYLYAITEQSVLLFVCPRSLGQRYLGTP